MFKRWAQRFYSMVCVFIRYKQRDATGCFSLFVVSVLADYFIRYCELIDLFS